jgi:hypothetical protein
MQLVPPSQIFFTIIVASRLWHGVGSRNEVIVTSRSCKC